MLEGLAELGLRLRPRDVAFRTDHDVACLAALRAGASMPSVRVVIEHLACGLRRYVV